MAVILYLQNKDYHMIKQIGMIIDEEVMALTEVAKKYNLHCLRGIDYVGDTVLNQKQLVVLKQELSFLKALDIALHLNIAPLEKAADEVMKYPDLYLMVNGE